MRRKDREMDESFALGIMDKCECPVLSMADNNGEPYCVPISIVRDGQDIFFHCAKEGTAIWKATIQTISGKQKKYDNEGKEMKLGRMQ